MENLRIGVIGAGIIGQTHIATIKATPGFTLSAFVEPADAPAAILEREGAKRFTSAKALMDSGLVDGVIIATPNETHAPIACELLAGGINVLIEKPVTNTVEEAQAIMAAEARSRARALVGHHRRHNPIVATAKASIDDGLIGDLVNATVLSTLMKPDDYFQVAWRRKDGVGGPFRINLIHEIDMLRHLFGEVAWVSATRTFAPRSLPVEDGGAAMLGFANGGLAAITISDRAIGPWAWDIASGENTARFPKSGAEAHFYSGTRGALSLPSLTFWSHDGTPSWTTPMTHRALTFEPGDPYQRQLQHFGDVIRGTAVPLISALDGARDIATLDAILLAAEKKCEVEVVQVVAPAS